MESYDHQSGGRVHTQTTITWRWRAMSINPKVTMFAVEGAPHHYIPPASDWRLEAYLDGNSAPLKDYLRQRCYSLGAGTYTVHVDSVVVRDYVEQQAPLPKVSELVVDVPAYWYGEKDVQQP